MARNRGGGPGGRDGSLEGFLRTLRGLPRETGGTERAAPMSASPPPYAEGAAHQNKRKNQTSGSADDETPREGTGTDPPPNLEGPPGTGMGVGVESPLLGKRGRKRGREGRLQGA
ncbi:uncharacterized protein TM35_000261770 [Trypanosoma theileri]|uniref:Uncharacterized protein n=1 Tax=Trypanosoma theileri TaxID=67003 RepID=A0A1X0NPU2_9TRYP|nr:uncharacterized protein TM35_000261770 [Trypanosoma theileri]ORC86725.1 hypothetical protein TM35_000261770 [Trypanosoma theileri]